MRDVSIKTAAELTTEERQAWAALQAKAPELASPYFSLGYLDAVSQARGDVRVVINREAGAPIGFMPLQLGALRHARPLGGPLSDHHGVIGHMGEASEFIASLRQVGVSVFDFHGALALQGPFKAFQARSEGSWVIDLSDGFEAWRSRRKKPGGNTLRTILVAERKLAERHGELEFRFDDPSSQALEALYAWKSEQYRRSGHFDVFSVKWTRDLIDALLNCDPGGGAKGVLSSLRVDGQIAAVHFGMTGGGVMHYWFPAYDPALQKDGGGNALLVNILREVAGAGVREVHLGAGDYRFKAALADWQFPIVNGFIGHGAVAAARRLALKTEILAARAPLGPLNDFPGRLFRKIDQITGFRAA